MWGMVPVTVIAISALLLGGAARAQQTELTFDAAVIRRSPPNQTPSVRRLPDGQFRTTGRPMGALLLMGWPEHFSVTGYPPWMQTDSYDVMVKPAAGSTPTQIQEMWRSLLTKRLRLRVHSETRDVQAYALVLARRDGGLGQFLRPSTLTCEANATQPPIGASADLASVAAEHCGTQFWMDGTVGRVVSGGATMAQLAQQLRSSFNRPVVDETKLKGSYAVDLRYDAVAANTDPQGLSDARDVFTALREQLGLRLESSNAPVQILVVDQAEPPLESEN